jgi:hypothetical protein
MGLRSQLQNKPSQISIPDSSKAQLRSRSFVVQTHPETVSAKQREPPDLQTQLEIANQLGHSFSKISASTPSSIQPKLIAAPLTPITQLNSTVQLIQRAVAPDLAVGTKVEIWHDRKWQQATILKAEKKKEITTYTVRRNGGKKQRTYKHTSNDIRPISVVAFTPPGSARQSVEEEPSFSSRNRLTSQGSSIPPLRGEPQFDKPVFRNEPPPSRTLDKTPPSSPRGVPTFDKGMFDLEPDEMITNVPSSRTPPRQSLRSPLSGRKVPVSQDDPEVEDQETITTVPFSRTLPRQSLRSPLSGRKVPVSQDDPEVGNKFEKKGIESPIFNSSLRRTPPREEWAKFSQLPFWETPDLRDEPEKFWQTNVEDESAEKDIKIPAFLGSPTQKTPPSSLRGMPGSFFNPQSTQSTAPRFSPFLKDVSSWQQPTNDTEYIKQVAAGFSTETRQVFEKLWQTAPDQEKKHIKHLFSPDPKLKNLADLEYILEALDPQHRMDHKFGLCIPAREWVKDSTKEYFFDWVVTQPKYEPYLQGDQVDYFDEEQRQNYELKLGSTITWLKSQIAPGEETIYAMSQTDQFYASPRQSTDRGIVHHSSFMSGQAVKCAGHMWFNSPGRLSKIDLNSGHYKPKSGQMLNALKVLHKNNVDLKNVEAELEFGQPPTTALEILEQSMT